MSIDSNNNELSFTEAETNETLFHLIYASSSTVPFDDQDLVVLLTKARKNNEQLGITGMLLHTEGNFFQILEGEEQTVSDLFNLISQDKRHDQIVRIISEPIAERAFGDWSMSFTSMSTEELRAIPGFTDVIDGGSSLLKLSKGRAKKLMKAFVDGKWRRSLQRNAG